MSKTVKKEPTVSEKKADLTMIILLFLWIGIPGFIVLQTYDINPMSVKIEIFGIVYAIISMLIYTKVVNHFKIYDRVLEFFKKREKR